MRKLTHYCRSVDLHHPDRNVAQSTLGPHDSVILLLGVCPKDILRSVMALYAMLPATLLVPGVGGHLGIHP